MKQDMIDEALKWNKITTLVSRHDNVMFGGAKLNSILNNNKNIPV